MNRTMINNEIENSKKTFNTFFKADLYGRYGDNKNIILSRGGWNDGFVGFPKIYDFCVRYALKKHWTGYSDSLGHRNTIRALLELVNLEPISNRYKIPNVALTLGNVVTIGFVFRQLKSLVSTSEVITLKPYYPSIIKSINYYFPKVSFLSSLQSENSLIGEIKKSVESDNNKILFLSNSIGVDGRIFSVSFWNEMVKISSEKKIYLVIDEGMWFERLKYCSDINSDYVIRIVSLSKKYGLPGCKLGHMLASEKFISEYYDYASTNYGGPLSFFFLLSEFVYQFEFLYYSKSELNIGLETLNSQYGIPIQKLRDLYHNFVKTLENNKKNFEINMSIFTKWTKENSNLLQDVYNFGGINVFVRPKIRLKAYDIFLKSIAGQKVSVMPSSCLGDEFDSMFRVTLLENSSDLKEGLLRLGKIIADNYIKI